MDTNEQKIKCPKCNTLISIDDVLTHQIGEKIRREIENDQKIKEADIANKQKELGVREAQLEERNKNTQIEINKKVVEKLGTERITLWKQAQIEASKEKDAEKKMFEAQLAEKDAKLQEANENELALRKEKNKLEEDKKSFELEKQRQLDDERKKIFQEANEKANKENQYVIAQLKKQLTDATKVNDDLARKLEQGSQQSQGEVLELKIEDILKLEFQHDEITPVAKGVPGPDIIQKVFDRSGRICGQIAWESKNTKAWSEGWIQKLKDDQRAAKADLAVIVSVVLPDDVKGFSLRDGVFVCDVNLTINLASLLRYDLIKISEANRALAGKDEKKDVVYAYINSIDFKQRIQTIAEAFIEMKNDIDKEKRSYQAIWAKREKQVQRVVDNTFGIYGDLKGLTGGSIQEIKMLELGEGNN